MAQQIIDTETDHGSYKGDPAKVAFLKANQNFSELYAATAVLAAYGGSNMLINCGVPINQRAFAGGSLAAGAYGYDRWKAGPGGGNVTIDPGTGQFNHSSGPLVQAIESPLAAWGQPLFISVENPSGPVQVSVGGATGTISSGAGRRGVQLTPSGSGNLVVQLTATGVTYSRPKVERGTVATSFDARHVAFESILCKRYYEANGLFATVYGASGQDVNTTVAFSVQKRATPAVGLVAPQYANASAGSIFAQDPNKMVVQFKVGSLGAATINTGWTADAEI